MKKKDWLTKNFEDTRKHLVAVAYQMLGSATEAEDAVQETWIRLNRSESEQIENLRGWLTTVVARVCLDMLRSRKAKREDDIDDKFPEASDQAHNPEDLLLTADSVGSALLLVLDLLTPSERIAFVLHDIFDLSFEEIAIIIDRTEEATRQLASRARRRVRGANTSQEDSDRQKEMVAAFLSASKDGNFEALIRLLHPDVVLRADATAIKISEANKSKGAPQFKSQITGAKNVADTFKGKASAAQLASINGAAGATWAPGGKPVVAFTFSVSEGKISSIDITMDKEALEKFDIAVINNKGDK
ncbi:ECF RNA polymerase sigma factor SigJ [compost metagenome]